MANGKIKADTLEHSTAGSLDTKFVVNGSAKQFLVASYGDFSIGTSLNASSVTDRGTGLGTVNATNAFSSVNRAGASQASYQNNSDGATNYNTTCTFIRNSTNTSQNYMNAWNRDGSLQDVTNVSGAMFGDLA